MRNICIGRWGGALPDDARRRILLCGFEMMRVLAFEEGEEGWVLCMDDGEAVEIAAPFISKWPDGGAAAIPMANPCRLFFGEVKTEPMV